MGFGPAEWFKNAEKVNQNQSLASYYTPTPALLALLINHPHSFTHSQPSCTSWLGFDRQLWSVVDPLLWSSPPPALLTKLSSTTQGVPLFSDAFLSAQAANLVESPMTVVRGLDEHDWALLNPTELTAQVEVSTPRSSLADDRTT